MDKEPEKLGAEYYRNYLTQQGQAFYDAINAQLLRGDYSGETTAAVRACETAAADCFAAYRAIRDDHPEYFYLGFPGSEFVRKGKTGRLKYQILYSPDRIERIRRQLSRSIYSIVRGTAFLEKEERERLVYERIALKLTYRDHHDFRDHNIVGPVLMSNGVCEGHNALLLLCFRRIGIPCIKVYGRTRKGSRHCWTIAWIDGRPVHCDVTWEETEGGVSFDYFNKSDAQISRDHCAFKSSRIPVCKGLKRRFAGMR